MAAQRVNKIWPPCSLPRNQKIHIRHTWASWLSKAQHNAAKHSSFWMSRPFLAHWTTWHGRLSHCSALYPPSEQGISTKSNLQLIFPDISLKKNKNCRYLQFTHCDTRFFGFVKLPFLGRKICADTSFSSRSFCFGQFQQRTMQMEERNLSDKIFSRSCAKHIKENNF